MEIGTRFGAYEVTARLGEGGMGEVFRAVDVHLGRAAAIKVLPASLAGDPERLARFEREAQTLASLNHPNIAQVFGFEKGEGHFRALVMELVEGPTLAERVSGLPVPLDEAIPIAVQIADGLESAHDHGIIHRDLKPQNIKVRADGTVKILDFGLAKAIASGSDSPIGSLANSPTITTPAMTHAGVVLGTAAYMSPEQAKGRAVDRRADIWAFGCVLFEMLTGKRAFGGSDVSEVFVSILRDEPEWSALPAQTPPHVRSLLRRCLQKDLRKRLPHIGVARLELGEPLTEAIGATPPGRTRVRWLAAATAMLVLALAAASWIIWTRPAPAPASPIRVRAELGTDPVALVGTSALSPDGKILVFGGRAIGDNVLRSSIYVRHLDRLDAQPIPGTEAGQSPFFSPDGRWIAFFAQDTLKKVPANGGAVATISAAPGARGGSWGTDDAIVFASAAGLSRVPASGGTPELIAKSAPGEPPRATPQILPGGRGILYGQAVSADPAAGSLFVQDLAGGAPKELVRGGRFPRYTTSGHLTFVRSGTLFAVPFDLDRLEARGETVAVVEGIFQSAITATPNLAFSENGTLSYQPGAALTSRQAPVMWLTQSGPLTPLRRAATTFGSMRFSPDGRRLAMTVSDGRQADIWVYDWERDIATRITTDPIAEIGPVWTPDGTGLVYSTARGGTVSNLYWQRADGTGEAVRLTTSTAAQIADSFDPEGKRLVFHEGDPATGRQSLVALPIEHDANGVVKGGTPATLIGGAFLKANARISPDGKWIAYTANDTGMFEIYVQRFPELGQRVQVSNSGGNLALWSQHKNELYYAGQGPGRLMAVSYSVSDGVFVPARPRQWSQTEFSPPPPLAGYGPAFDIHPDGERFAVTPPLQPVADASGRSAQLVLLFNFFDELRRVAPIR